MPYIVTATVAKSHIPGQSTKTDQYQRCTGRLGRRVPFDYARRIGWKIKDTNKRILVRLIHYDDKECLLRYMDNSPCLSENLILKYENLYERVHTSLMKRVSNASKYSAMHVYSEHWPGVSSSKHSWASYWIRLCDGANNVLLNKCFKLSVYKKPQWIHCIHLLLTSNGLGYIWCNPSMTCG